MEKIIDKTYSESLLEFAKENNTVDKFYEQAKDIIEVFSNSPEFMMFLTNPKISGEEKKEVIQKVFANSIWKGGTSASGVMKVLTNPEVSGAEKKEAIKNVIDEKILKNGNSTKILDFIYLVIDKGRESHLIGIFNSFCDDVREYKQIGLCEINSATELTAEQKKKIQDKLLQITDFSSFEFIYKLDSSLLAGLKIKIGDTVVDTSVKHKLERINKSLRGIKL